MKDYPDVPTLDYQSLRGRVKPGDLWLCSGNRVFSRMIRRATSSVWSHVAFVMPVKSIDRVLVMESVESVGVRAVPASQYVSNYTSTGKRYPGRIFLARHKAFPGTAGAAAPRDFTRFAVDQLGYPYDKSEIIAIAARIALGCKCRAARDKAFICSEFVWECYDSIGIQVALGRPGFIAPSDFPNDPDVTVLYELEF